MKILSKIPHRNRSYLLREIFTISISLRLGYITKILLSNTLINYKEMKSETENWGVGVGHVVVH